MSSGVLETLSQGEGRAGSSARVFNTFESVFNLVQTGSNPRLYCEPGRDLQKHGEILESVPIRFQSGSNWFHVRGGIRSAVSK